MFSSILNELAAKQQKLAFPTRSVYWMSEAFHQGLLAFGAALSLVAILGMMYKSYRCQF